MKPSLKQDKTDRILLSVWHGGKNSGHDNFDIFIATKDYRS
jgi:hypothetical protein